MAAIKDRIEDIKANGYQLDFGTVFEHAFNNYKKIALYAGLLLFVFAILFTIILSTGLVSYIGVNNMDEFNKNINHYSTLKVFPKNILIPFEAGIILFSCLLAPFTAGFFKMADCGEKGEEFHVSTMFNYYKAPYFWNIFIVTLSISLLSSGLTMLLEFSGIQFVGSLISLTVSFLTFLTVPLIVFGKLSAFEAIKSSIIIVSKQPIILLGLLIVAIIGVLIGLFGFCIGVFFTYPFIYSTYYAIYSAIIGIDAEDDIEELEFKI